MDGLWLRSSPLGRANFFSLSGRADRLPRDEWSTESSGNLELALWDLFYRENESIIQTLQY